MSNYQYIIATPINTTQGKVIHIESTITAARAHLPDDNNNLSIADALFLSEVDPSSDMSRARMDALDTDQPFCVGDLIAACN